MVELTIDKALKKRELSRYDLAAHRNTIPNY